MVSRFLVLACLMTLATGAGASPPPAPDAAARASGVLVANFDRTVRPQDDFFRAWHGKWLADFEIPSDKAEYAAFTALHDTAQEQLRDIIVELGDSTPEPGSVAARTRQ